MSCGELGKGAKTEHTPEPTDIHSPFNACMYRGHCKGLEKQRDELLKAAEAAMQCIGEMGPTKARVEVFMMLQDAIASVKGGA